MPNPPPRLSLRDWCLLAEAWLTLAWVDLVIWLVPFRYWRRWLSPRAIPPAPRSSIPATALVAATERAARHHWRPMNCLRRSLALQRLLMRRRIPGQLHIGVRKGEDGIEAHAWISSGERILNDRPDVCDRYAELGPVRDELAKNLT